MLLILRYLLSEMEKDQDCEKVRWLHHIAIPEHIVSESSLRDLCNVGIQGLEERRWKVERMKAGLEKRIQESMEAKVKSQKPEPEDADSEGPMKSKHVKTEVKHDPEDEKIGSSKHAQVQPDRGCKRSASPQNGAARAKAFKPGDQSDPAKQKISESDAPAASHGQSVAVAPDVVFEEQLVLRAGALVDERGNKKAAKRREQKIKLKLRSHGLDNDVFQKAHKGTPMAGRGAHWKNFLRGAQGEIDIDCEVCACLLKKHNIDLSGQPTPPRKKHADSANDSAANPVSEPNELQSPPKKRARAGRPTKQESAQDDTFCLLYYLAEKRPDQYRFLSKEEAIERMPKYKAMCPDAVETEMKKRPVQCLVCGTFPRFPVLTNTLALRLGQH